MFCPRHRHSVFDNENPLKKKDYIFKTVTTLVKNKYTKMYLKYIYFMLSILQICSVQIQVVLKFN